MNDATIKYFHQQLINLINNCGLQAGTAYFVVKDVLNELEKIYNQNVQEDYQTSNQETQSIEIPVNENYNEEETENEYTNTESSEYSGGISNN